MPNDLKRETFEKWWSGQVPDSNWGKELAWNLWRAKQESHDD